jgi:hypothetical protein
VKYDPFYEGKIDRMRDEISEKHRRIAELEASNRVLSARLGELTDAVRAVLHHDAGGQGPAFDIAMTRAARAIEGV